MVHAPPNEIMSDNVASIDQHGSREWVELIVKLRWIGLEEEAQRLQQVLSTLASEDKGTVAVGPFNTD